MFNSISNFYQNIFISLPSIARQRLFLVSGGWMAVALAEAITYILLAFSIIHHLSPLKVVAFAILTVTLTVIVSRQGYLTGVRLAGDLYQGLGTALASAKLSWFNQMNRVKVASMAGQSIPRFMSIPAHQLQTFIHAPSLAVFLLIGLGWLAGITVAILAFILLLSAFILQWYGQLLLLKSDKHRHQLESSTNQSTLTFVEHIELLRTSAGINGAIHPLEKDWQNQNYSFNHINRMAAIATCLSILASVLPVAGLVISLWFLNLPVDSSLLALIIVIARAAAPIEQLALATLGLNDLKKLFSDYSQLRYVPRLNEPNKIGLHDFNKFTELNDSKKFEITINQGTYPPVLNGINLVIPYQTRLQISGASGSGKSTLLELLLRFDDLQTGSICLGGIRLSDFPYDELIKHIAYVPQESIIFTGTLAENIRIGRPQATDEEIQNIAQKMALTDLIQRSPQGIYQSVGRQGSALSGGERQRVALARAIIKEAPILIIDEGTSALDEKTENNVVTQIRQLNSTIIFVTHRLSDIWQPHKTYYLP